MKFRLSKSHLLCFVSVTFSRSPHISSGEINIDRKMEKEQFPVMKGRASLKMSLIQNARSEILID